MTLDERYLRHQTLWHRIAGDIDPADLAHEHLHVERVYRWCIRLATDAGADPDLCGAAALVHDLVNIPKDSSDRAKGGEQSATASIPLLSESGYQKHEVEEIFEAVRTSSWSRGLPPTNPTGMVLQDADRLDAIGAVGIVRTFATAQKIASRSGNLSLYSVDEPIARNRPSSDREFAVDHFTSKLLLLKDGMHTDLAKREAERRHGEMLRFLDELERETL